MDGDSGQGLSASEAARRLRADGPNALPLRSRDRLSDLLREVLQQPMVLLLLACGGLYLALGDPRDALMLLGFVLVVVAITTVQKHRSERSLEALRELSSPRAMVVRDDQVLRIAGHELVCGDLVLLSEGDRIPADLRLLEVNHLSIDESLLTGESVPVAKSVASPTDMAWSGTLVTQGRGRGRVVATGARSTLGRIGASLSGIDSPPTPVQRETQAWVTWIATLGLGLAAILTLLWGFSRGDWLHGLLAGLTLAMAILPEELPVVLTLFLGLGAWRLAAQKVLTRNMSALELLGATTVLCVDKTGTLTLNRMALRHLWSDGRRLEVSPQGSALSGPFEDLLTHALAASHRRPFDPIEIAIDLAARGQLRPPAGAQTPWQWVSDYPLSSDLLAMSRVWRADPDGECRVAAKGAPEAVIDLCHLPEDQQRPILSAVAQFAGDGLRVLAVARARWPSTDLPAGQHDFDFEFLGLLAFEDPVRPDVPAAIAACRAAGIRVVMITGDHAQTALAIAAQAGVSAHGPSLSGAQIDALEDAELAQRLSGVDVFCRVQPQQKLRLVQALQARGEIVVMTGDGVNDAPALKAAHIGVAMGARGSDVAREAADLVLLKDDFGSLVLALREGRRVFANLQKAMAFLLAVHLPIVGLSVMPALMGGALILMPVHILFLQLIIDPVCALVFEAEPLEAEAMRRPPRPAQAPLFDRPLVTFSLALGAGELVVVGLAHGLALAWWGSESIARTLSFSVLVLSSLLLIQHLRRPHAVHSAFPGWNRVWVGIVLLTLVLLAMTLMVPALATVFALSWPPSGGLLLGAALCAVAALWFRVVTAWTGSA